LQWRGRTRGRTALIESFAYSAEGALDESSGRRLREAGSEPAEVIRRTLKCVNSSIAFV
jgi:hypothetical protein